jgi:conjugative relaxase-like TrwC/TraI family protein
MSREVRAALMAWFRPMGAAEVAYHQETVVGRADDHPGAALDYYGSRGETPLRWGGTGAARFGLKGEVTAEAYEATFGPGGFTLPGTGERLVATKRPGFELVVSAHKSVAMLGVIDRADAMHSILDTETAATMDWLDRWFQDRGGRRGRAAQRTATGGLVYGVTRHGTSRAGDPSPHDHVLVANVAEMLDTCGGFKGLDSAALRDTVEAATMVGRLHSAARAVELGFTIAPDDGPSGRLRHWRIVGVPDEVCEVFSKRADEIAEHLATTGHSGYRAAGMAARATRSVKRHTGIEELMPVWHAELEAVGWSVERLATHIGRDCAGTGRLPVPLTDREIDDLAASVLDIDGALLAGHKVFTATNLVAELAPRLYGRHPGELSRVLDRVLSVPGLVPLIGVAGTREQAFTTAEVLAAEAMIAQTVEALATSPGPELDAGTLAAAIARTESERGNALTAGQRELVEQVSGSGRAVTVVVGVAGSGKTTALDCATTLLEDAGYQVLGTSTSGQAARTLGTEAGIDSSTFASLLWSLDQGTVSLDARTVIVIDEAGMADDSNLARLTLAAHRAGSAMVLVGDPRQLDAVGPGGALTALIARHPDLVVTLDENVRQTNSAERHALAELRHGDPAVAMEWYVANDRLHVTPDRIDTLAGMADAWASDILTGHHTALLAWRRDDVADLNRLARHQWDQLGHLSGDDIELGGRRYAVGDRIVALAPNRTAGLVTSELLTVVDLDQHHLMARTDTGRTVSITGDGLDRRHLDHGYALTIHRAQGATYDRAHVLAGNGGRELAYVALSRARDRTIVHATADDIGQALSDLATDWGAERHQRWINDTPARPGTERSPSRQRPHEPTIENVASGPTGVPDANPRRRQPALEAHYFALMAGDGPWTNTPEGHAARDRKDALDRLAAAEQVARHPKTGRRDRRAATKALPALTEAAAIAEERWAQIGAPIAKALTAEIAQCRRDIERHERQAVIQALNQLERPGPEPDLGLGL